MGRFTTRDPLSALTGSGTGRSDYAFAKGSPVNRVDPSGLFSNALIARSFGFSGDEEGFQQLVNEFDTYSWAGKWGFLHMLQRATPGSRAESHVSTPWPSATWYYKLSPFECRDGMIKAVGPDPGWPWGDGTLTLEEAMIPLWLGNPYAFQGLWRPMQYGIFYLYPSGIRYTDTDVRNSLPDFVIVGSLVDETPTYISGIDVADVISILAQEAVNLGPVGITVERTYIVDRYGNTYVTWSGGVEIEFGIPLVELAWGEGYVNRADGRAANDLEIRDALTGIELSVSASALATVDWSRSATIYGADLSFGVGLSVESGTQLAAKVPGWDWSFAPLGYSVAADSNIVRSCSLPPDPLELALCGECSP